MGACVEPTRAEGESAFRNPPSSVAAAAQLLELWLQGRALLDRDAVEQCLSILSELDMAVGLKYDELFVNTY